MAKQTKDAIPPKRKDHDRRCNYKVSTEFMGLRLQKRLLFFFWITIEEYSTGWLIPQSDPKFFKSIKEARLFISNKRFYLRG